MPGLGVTPLEGVFYFNVEASYFLAWRQII
jgi:hypothetical protein